jgi:KaiC/GvpD/RAD55 family RecA-like ATPase
MAISDLIGGFFSKNTAKAVAEGQFGFININKMQSTNRELEKDIIENVASYGMQLGQIIDTVRIVIEKLDLNVEEYPALRKFNSMAEEIAVVKRNYFETTKDNIDRFIKNILPLKESDPITYKEVLDRLRKEFFTETKSS